MFRLGIDKTLIALVIAIVTTISGSSANADEGQTVTGSAGVSSSTVPVNERQSELARQVAQLLVLTQAQQAEIAAIKGAVVSASAKEPGPNPMWATAALLLAAAIAAGVALRNQNEQARQSRILKAVEIIMQSRTGHQARMRIQNLDGFLDKATRLQLRNPNSSGNFSDNFDKLFGGTEWTDLRIELAKAMAQKATTAQDVLEIWRAVASDKTAVTSVEYQSAR